jgi:hypothetical protein
VDGRKDKMANDQTSFDDLVSEAPAATVSVVGTLAKSGKFILVLQNAGTVTLETAAVKGHTVLGTSLGQTIVRVDVDVEKLRDPIPLPWLRDPVPVPWATPFALAAPQQASPAAFAAFQSPSPDFVFGKGGADLIGKTTPLESDWAHSLQSSVTDLSTSHSMADLPK